MLSAASQHPVTLFHRQGLECLLNVVTAGPRETHEELDIPVDVRLLD
jgi:hypothetical protein